MKLYDFQRNAVAAVLGGLRGSSRTALLVSPTGSGKTIMMAATIKAEMQRRRQRVLILQHTTPLLSQNHDKVKAICAGLRFGELGGGKAKGLAHADVTVATMQSAKGDIAEHLKPFDLVIVDEAHHAPAAGYRDLIRRLRARNPDLALLGLTATPGRSDGVGLDVLFDRVSHQIPLDEVLKSGLVVPPRVFSADLGAVSEALGVHAWTDGDDAQASRMLRVEVTLAEMVRQHIAHAEGRRAVYFCCDTEHAEALAASFASAGLRSLAVSHRTRKGALKAALSDFKAGRYDVIANPLMLTEGFDDPALGCVGLARGFGSKHLLVQAVGRVMRGSPETGKRDGLVLDFVRASDRHGDLFPSLAIASKMNKKGAVARGRPIEPTEVIEADTVLMAEVDMLGGLLDRIEIGELVTPSDADVTPEELAALPRTRAEALAVGGRYFFTGEPCSHGHVSVRRVNGGCQTCIRASDLRSDRLAAKALYKRGRRTADAAFRQRSLDYIRNWKMANKSKRDHAKSAVKAAADPAWKSNPKEYRRAWRAAKMATDPDWRAKRAEKDRARRAAKMATDPDWKAKQAEKDRARRAAKNADPVWKAKEAERNRARAKARKADPVVRAAIAKSARERRKALKNSAEYKIRLNKNNERNRVWRLRKLSADPDYIMKRRQKEAARRREARMLKRNQDPDRRAGGPG